MSDYTLGVDRGVLYVPDLPGQPWNGLVSVEEDISDSVSKSRYIDGVKNHYQQSAGSFSGTIQAFTYPDVFFEYTLTQKRRKSFGFSYRTQKASSYQIHLVYNAAISPEGISREQSETEPFSWKFSTLPIPVPGSKHSAHLVIDTSIAYSWTVAALEDVLYGADGGGTSRLPSPQEVYDIFEENSILRVTDHGDGTFTVDGPDSAIVMLDSTTFQITWPSAIPIDDDSYTISSL